MRMIAWMAVGFWFAEALKTGQESYLAAAIGMVLFAIFVVGKRRKS